MRVATSLFSAAFLGLLASAPAPVRAAESLDTCVGTIASVPTVITTQGTWCLNHDLNTGIGSGNAIAINTNNVTIDCNGYKLGGLAAGPGSLTIGILANGRENVTIRNCTIRGFLYGALLIGDGHVIRDNRIEGNLNIGVAIQGESGLVRGNQIMATGGSTHGGSPVGVGSYGAVDVIDNTIADVMATAGSGVIAIGVEISGTSSRSIAGNRIRNVIGEAASPSQAIYNNSSAIGGASIRDNTLFGGFANTIAINCWSSDLFIVSGNHVQGFVGGGIGAACVDGGGNTVIETL